MSDKGTPPSMALDLSKVAGSATKLTQAKKSMIGTLGRPRSETTAVKSPPPSALGRQRSMSGQSGTTVTKSGAGFTRTSTATRVTVPSGSSTPSSAKPKPAAALPTENNRSASGQRRSLSAIVESLWDSEEEEDENPELSETVQLSSAAINSVALEQSMSFVPGLVESSDVITFKNARSKDEQFQLCSDYQLEQLSPRSRGYAEKITTSIRHLEIRLRRSNKGVKREGDRLSKASMRIQSFRKEADDLSKIDPAVLEEARKAVAKISDAAWREVRGYSNPPHIVRRVLEAVLLVMGHPTRDWETIRQRIKTEDFIEELNVFTAEKVKPEHIARLESQYISDEKFTIEAANRASKAAPPLLKWCNAQFAHYDTLRTAALRMSEASEEEKNLFNRKERLFELAKEAEGALHELEKEIDEYKIVTSRVAFLPRNDSDVQNNSFHGQMAMPPKTRTLPPSEMPSANAPREEENDSPEPRAVLVDAESQTDAISEAEKAAEATAAKIDLGGSTDTTQQLLQTITTSEDAEELARLRDEVKENGHAVVDLEEKLEALRQENRELTLAAEKANAAAAAAETEANVLHDQLNEMEEKIEEADKSASDSKKARMVAESAHAAALAASTAEADAKIAELEASLEDHKKKARQQSWDALKNVREQLADAEAAKDSQAVAHETQLADSIESAVAPLRDQIEEESAARKKANDELQAAQSVIEALKAALEEERNGREKDNTDAKASAEDAAATAEAQRADLQRLLDELQASNADTQQQLSQVKDDVSKAEKDAAEAAEKVATLENALETRTSELEKAVEDVDAASKAATAAAAGLAAENEAALAALREELSQARLESEEIAAQMKGMEEEKLAAAQEHEEQWGAWETEKEALKTEIETHTATAKESLAASDANREESDSLSKRIAELEAQLTAAQTEAQAAKESNDSTAAKLSEAEASSTEQEAALAALREELTQARSEYDDVAAKMQEVEEAKLAAEQQHEEQWGAWETEKEALKTEIASASAKEEASSTATREESDSLSKRIAELEAQLTAAQAEAQAAKDTNDSTSAKLTEAEATSVEQEAALAALREELSQARLESEEIATQMKGMEEEHVSAAQEHEEQWGAWETEKEALQQEVSTIKTERTTISDESTTLKVRIEELEAALADEQRRRERDIQETETRVREEAAEAQASMLASTEAELKASQAEVKELLKQRDRARAFSMGMAPADTPSASPERPDRTEATVLVEQSAQTVLLATDESGVQTTKRMVDMDEAEARVQTQVTTLEKEIIELRTSLFERNTEIRSLTTELKSERLHARSGASSVSSSVERARSGISPFTQRRSTHELHRDEDPHDEMEPVAVRVAEPVRKEIVTGTASRSAPAAREAAETVEGADDDYSDVLERTQREARFLSSMVEQQETQLRQVVRLVSRRQKPRFLSMDWFANRFMFPYEHCTNDAERAVIDRSAIASLEGERIRLKDTPPASQQQLGNTTSSGYSALSK